MSSRQELFVFVVSHPSPVGRSRRRAANDGRTMVIPPYDPALPVRGIRRAPTSRVVVMEPEAIGDLTESVGEMIALVDASCSVATLGPPPAPPVTRTAGPRGFTRERTSPTLPMFAAVTAVVGAVGALISLSFLL